MLNITICSNRIEKHFHGLNVWCLNLLNELRNLEMEARCCQHVIIHSNSNRGRRKDWGRLRTASRQQSHRKDKFMYPVLFKQKFNSSWEQEMTERHESLYYMVIQIWWYNSTVQKTVDVRCVSTLHSSSCKNSLLEYYHNYKSIWKQGGVFYCFGGLGVFQYDLVIWCHTTLVDLMQ